MRGHRHHGHRPEQFQGRASRRYDILARRVLRGAYRRLAKDAAAAAPIGGAVLDVGTGPGVLLVELARLRPDLRVTGVDLSADMASLARRNLAELGERAAARQGDVTDLPFPDESFDLIVSSLSLHHWDDVAVAASELARVLRPGGQVYLYDISRAPFAKLVEAAAGAGLTIPAAPWRTPIRVGMLGFPKIVRCVMTDQRRGTVPAAA